MRTPPRPTSLAAFALAGGLLLAAGAATAAPASAPPGDLRTFAVEMGWGPSEATDVYQVPAGKIFVLTDVIALREGNTDGLLRLHSGDKLMATMPMVGIVSATDLYGVHLTTGIPFPGGEPVRLKKSASGAAWVTLVGYELPAG